MDDKLFFTYYLPALKQALSEDEIDYVFLVKSPSWFYPKETNLYRELIKYEDSNYVEYPILEMVAYYFDSKSHNFPDVGKIDIRTCRERIITEMNILATKFGIDIKSRLCKKGL